MRATILKATIVVSNLHEVAIQHLKESAIAFSSDLFGRVTLADVMEGWSVSGQVTLARAISIEVADYTQNKTGNEWTDRDIWTKRMLSLAGDAGQRGLRIVETDGVVTVVLVKEGVAA